ncbi:transcriptional regulator [Nonomuraea sp. NPDC049709]|uniref:transcriptional regulator n=1 Tax=Nonomuraea sp. NPDC049709 TaxID=3154736 RepID=UPI0034133D51
MSPAVATFAAVFAALYAAHSFGDHWYGQTHRQALGKGARTTQGVRHCLAHVLLLAAHKFLALVALAMVTGLWPSLAHVAVALAVDGVSHYWADRRYTLQALAERTGKGDFYQLGQPRPGRDDAHHLGTGAYAMDQSWHVAWLFVTALIIAAGATG